MLWGVPIWIWVVFFASRILLVAAGGILWVHFFSKVLWSKKIEKKYYGGMLKEKQTEEGEAAAEKR